MGNLAHLKILECLAELSMDIGSPAKMYLITGPNHFQTVTDIRETLSKVIPTLYFRVSRKTPGLLLQEWADIITVSPSYGSTPWPKTFEEFFSILFSKMHEGPMAVIFDDIQDYKHSECGGMLSFQAIEALWLSKKTECNGAIFCISSDTNINGSGHMFQSSMDQHIRISSLSPEYITNILEANNVRPEFHLLFYYSIFGGIPHYYSMLDQENLFSKYREKLIKTLFCDNYAYLRDEGTRLVSQLINDSPRSYSVLQTVASGALTLTSIAAETGIERTTISKYIGCLVYDNALIEHRIPVTAIADVHKNGRYHITNPLLGFWFRFIYPNQTLMKLCNPERAAVKIIESMPPFLEYRFAELIRELLPHRNDTSIIPFEFSRIGAYWDKMNKLTVDIVAVDDSGKYIFFGACRVDGNKFTDYEANRLLEGGRKVPWGMLNREEHFGLFSFEPFNIRQPKSLSSKNISCISISRLITFNHAAE